MRFEATPLFPHAGQVAHPAATPCGPSRLLGPVAVPVGVQLRREARARRGVLREVGEVRVLVEAERGLVLRLRTSGRSENSS